GGADLLACVGARRRRRARRADAARDEDLDVVRAPPQVLAGPAAYLVHAVVAREDAAVAVVRGEPAPRYQQPRARDDALLDRLAQVQVEEVLLAHHAHRGRAGGEVAREVPRGGQRLGDGAAGELSELISEAGDDRRVAVAVHQARHHEATAEV